MQWWSLLLIGSVALPALAVESGAPYLIGPEDVLEISVWKEDDLQKEVLVRPDGGLTFPLIGQVNAAGRTVESLTEEITKRLEHYITKPVVTVGVRQVGGNKIYVVGKVNRPGEFATGRYVSVMQALTMAGGLTPYAANTKVKILRRNADGNTTALSFNYDEITDGKNLEQNVLLQNGDVVVVP